MASLQYRSQSYLACQITQSGILHFQWKCKYQEKRHKKCYYFLSSVLILLDKYPYSVSQRYCNHLINQSKGIIDFSNIDWSKLTLCLNPVSFFVGQKVVCKKMVLGQIPLVFQLLESLRYFHQRKSSYVKEALLPP